MAKSFVIPSDPADRAKIMSVVREISGSMTRTEGEKDYVKEALKKLSEDFQIPKKYLSKFATAYHKSATEEVRESNAEFEELLDALVPPPEDE